MSLRNKFFLLSGGIVAVLVLTISWFVHLRLGEAALDEAAGHLRDDLAVVRRLERERREGLVQVARLTARLDEVQAALGNGPGKARALERGITALEEPDAFALLVDAGGTLRRSAGAVNPEIEAADASTFPLGAALAQGWASGRWWAGGRLYEVAAAAVGTAEGRHGVVVYGLPVDPLLFAGAGLDRVQVAVLVDGRVAVSGAPAPVEPQQLAALGATLGPASASRVEIAGEPYLAQIGAGRLGLGGERYQLVALTPLAPAASSLGQDLRTQLPLIGLSALTVALIIAWLGAGELTSPLERSARVMLDMARTRRLDAELGALGKSTEVRLFYDAFQGLIRSLAHLERERVGSYAEAVAAVVVAIDARDNETTGHSFRVARYAVALAERLGLSAEQLQTLEWGALLHDIGKLAVPDAVLLKAGPLTEEEWHIMRQHPTWGVEILGNVRFLEPAVEIVGSHQERWDGSGYPDGLAGEEIPLGARIFAVVDTYDAITSDRPYRRARSHQEAVAEIRRVAGSQLEPRAAATFLEIPPEELAQLRDQGTRAEFELAVPRRPPRLGSVVA